MLFAPKDNRLNESKEIIRQHQDYEDRMQAANASIQIERYALERAAGYKGTFVDFLRTDAAKNIIKTMDWIQDH